MNKTLLKALREWIKEEAREPEHQERSKKKKASGGKVNWIQGAIKNPGALHETLGIPKGKRVPKKKLEKAEHSRSALTRKRANLAMTLRGLRD